MLLLPIFTSVLVFAASSPPSAIAGLSPSSALAPDCEAEKTRVKAQVVPVYDREAKNTCDGVKAWVRAEDLSPSTISNGITVHLLLIFTRMTDFILKANCASRSASPARQRSSLWHYDCSSMNSAQSNTCLYSLVSAGCTATYVSPWIEGRKTRSYQHLLAVPTIRHRQTSSWVASTAIQATRKWIGTMKLFAIPHCGSSAPRNAPRGSL